MRMPSLQGGIYGDFSIVGILSTRFSSIFKYNKQSNLLQMHND